MRDDLQSAGDAAIGLRVVSANSGETSKLSTLPPFFRPFHSTESKDIDYAAIDLVVRGRVIKGGNRIR